MYSYPLGTYNSNFSLRPEENMAESEPCATKNKRKARELWSTLRQVQRSTGCTTKTLKETFRSVQKFSGINERVSVPEAAAAADKNLLKTSGAWRIRLDGCVGCHGHVFLPSEKTIFCPECRHPRFNASKKPNEVNNMLLVVILHS